MAGLEQVFREVIREELACAQGVPIAHSLTPQAIGAAVRAEAARAGVRHTELAEALGVSRPTIAGRLSGAYEFQREELEKVAAVIGITAYNIIESAGLGARFGTTVPEAQVNRVLPRDIWAQPSRSKSRRRSVG